ncbi:MAG TPA: hypothetical protein VKF35_10545 [Hyphomicrobiaceae bacterium]|nr:hypothetical protein [Hyphomicrobiaceae bacterium]
MENATRRRKAMVTATVFGVIPCVLGLGIAQYLRWRGTVWLTSAGAFWPIVSLATSVAVLITLAVSSSKDRTARVWGWLILTWTWLYFPLWLTAREIPQSSAVVTSDGRVSVAGEWARQPSDRVWLLTGRAADKLVRNVTGTATVNAAELQYRFSEPYISGRRNGEDLSVGVIGAATQILAEAATKPRAWRIALFDKPEAHEQLLVRICRTIAPNEARCPLKLSLTPQTEATMPGAVWSKFYTETEAIAEQHLPTLVQLLTQDNSRLVDRDRTFALFIDLANSPELLSTVARRSSILSASQFDELIKRMIASPGCGNEAVAVLAKVNRLTQEQRRDLRAKVLREASLSIIANSAAALRISDAEVVQLAQRMHTGGDLTPEVAVLVLDVFGERLPAEAQHEAIAAIVKSNAAHALAALRHVNFSSGLREELVAKLVADGTYEDFEAAHLSRETLEEFVTPAEMRALVASLIKKSETSVKWLNFVVRVLPVRAMTPVERKTLLTGLLFESNKSALEFASEQRQYLDAEDVNEITNDYTKTITPDFCLHLSHRNKNRKTDYFSDDQLQIFRNCAQSK